MPSLENNNRVGVAVVRKFGLIKSKALGSCAFGTLGLLFCTLPCAAQSSDTVESVVVTASRLGGLHADMIGSSLSVLNSEDIESRQTQIVSDVLRDIPGVAVSRTGPVGGLTQIRMRGAEGNHTLVMIDGIKASDPYQGEFDFATLIADDVARVEVLRGQQSALYGSDAIGGVINYITASGSDASGVRGKVEGGSFGTIQASLRAAGVEDGFDYAVSGSYFNTDGVPDSRTGVRNLGSTNTVLAGKFSYTLGDLKLKLVTRLSNTASDINEQDWTYGSKTYGYEVDGNGSYHNQAQYGLVSAEYDLLEGHWKNALTLQGVNAARNDFGNSGYAADVRSAGDKGQREKFSYVSAFDFTTSDWVHTLTGAIDLEREYYRNTDPSGYAETGLHHNDTMGFVADYNVVYAGRLALGAAVRFDKNYNFKDDTTYHFQASYKFDMGLRLHAAAGSGVKNPGMYELFAYSAGTFMGNPDLKPEQSQGWEAGFEQSLFASRALIGVTYFSSILQDEIATKYVYTITGYYSTPYNATKSSPQRGIEANITVHLDENWSADIAYTYLHARQDGLQEVRRAPNIGSFNLSWNSDGGDYGANLTVRYNGNQQDYDYTVSPTGRANLKAFTLVNTDGFWKINDTFRLYGRVENLADEKYEEVYTFRAPGRAFYAGVKVGF